MIDTMYYVYILRCSDNSLYTGYTTDVMRRFSEHLSKTGKGAKYTHSRISVRIEAVWGSDSRSAAMRLEAFIKKLKKSAKEEIIKDNSLLLKKCSDKLDIQAYTILDRKSIYED